MDKLSVALEQLKGKPHFELLDGLRGIAALAVVIFHFMEWVFPDITKNFIGHGFLAVDFFFCLSGFVIGYAYDNRIQQTGKRTFFKLRLIRLHPLVVLGSVLGLLGYFLDPFATSSSQDTGQLALLFIASLLLLPLPVMEERFFNLFALNAPSWSLFWEYVANLVYALVLVRIGRRTLIVLTVIAAAGICFVSYRAGNLLGGWSKDNFWDGGVRVAYSFTAGLLLYRSNWSIKNSLGFPMLAILLSFAFLMPWFSWNWLAEALVVIFYFPLIVALGVGSTMNSNWKKICRFSGNISYPLYMTHYAAIWIFGSYYTTTKPSTEELILVVICGTIFLVAFAYFVMLFYDVPVRKYLARQRK
jgi:peptidoglycan/LPS O-acetylase OafA/YrhL